MHAQPNGRFMPLWLFPTEAILAEPGESSSSGEIGFS